MATIRDKFELKLLNQISDNEHLSVIINFIDSGTEHGRRVKTGDRADKGWGERYKLISNEDLHKVTATCQFLKDNCVYFEVNFHASND